MAKSTAETVVLRLEDQVSRTADAMGGALGRLESQIDREQGSLGRLESALGRAKAQLSALAEGAPDARAVAAFERQGEAVRALESKLADAQDTLAIMAQAKVTPEAFTGAQGAVEALAAKLEEACGKLSGLETAAKSRGVNLDAYRKQKDAVAALTDKVGAQKDKIGALVEKTGQLGKKTSDTRAQLTAANSAMRVLSGGTDIAGSRVVALGKAFAGAGPHVTAVVIALGLATLAGFALASAFAKAISSADSLRNELLDLRIAGVFWWDGQRANTAAALVLQGAVDKLSGSTAVAREKLVGYAVQLKDNYFRGKQLTTALEGMAIAGAAGGDKLASKFFALAQNARFFGQDLDKLTERFKKKFGAVAEARLLSLGVQFDKFKENIAFIFSGADIEPFLRGLQSVLGLFNRNEESAKSLRATVTKLTEYAIGAFLRLGIAIVKTYIAIRTNQTAWRMLGLVFDGIVLGIKVTTVVIGVLVAALVTGAALAVAQWGMLWSSLGKVTDAIGDLIDWVKNTNLIDAGLQMIRGLAEGIKNGAGAVWEAMKGAVSGAIDKTIAFLRIRSPSGLVADEVGEPMALGIPKGNEQAAPAVAAGAQKAAEGAVQAMGGAGARASSSESKTVNFTNCTFGSGTSQALIEKYVRAAFESDSLDATAAT